MATIGRLITSGAMLTASADARAAPLLGHIARRDDIWIGGSDIVIGTRPSGIEGNLSIIVDTIKLPTDTSYSLAGYDTPIRFATSQHRHGLMFRPDEKPIYQGCRNSRGSIPFRRLDR